MLFGFRDIYSFCGFFTSLFYNLTPLAFVYQLKHGVLKNERISIIALLSLYCNAFLYFFVSAFHYTAENQSIEPMDFCNLIGAYLGFVYLVIYIYYVYFKTNKLKAVLSIVSLIIGSGAFLFLVSQVIDEENNFWTYLLKYLGIIFNILENLPLGFSIIYLIKNKISEKYTLFGALFGILNTIVWFSWAFYSCFINQNNTDKPYQSLIANTIAVCLHIFQFFLFCKFKKDEEDFNSNIEETVDEINENEEITNDDKLNNSNNSNNNDKSDMLEEFM
jgi:hypothetical protein